MNFYTDGIKVVKAESCPGKMWQITGFKAWALLTEYVRPRKGMYTVKFKWFGITRRRIVEAESVKQVYCMFSNGYSNVTEIRYNGS